MVWDHEVPGSNPGAPTTFTRRSDGRMAHRRQTHPGARLARSRRRILLVSLPLGILLIGIVGWVLATWGQSLVPARISRTDATATAKAELRAIPTATPHPTIADSGEIVTPRSEVYVDGVSVPVGLTFTPDGRLFFSE